MIMIADKGTTIDRLCIFLGICLVVAIAFVWPTRGKVIRAAQSEAQAYWGNGMETSRRTYALSWFGSRARLVELMRDENMWIRFFAAYHYLNQCSAGPHAHNQAKSKHSLGPGRVVPKKGYSEENIQQAFDLLYEGFSDRDPSTHGLRSWTADHFPTYCDLRVIRVLAQAVSQDMVGRHFGEMDLGLLTGKSGDSLEGPLWNEWLKDSSSNLVWNGLFFEPEKKEGTNKPSEVDRRED